MSTKFFRFVTTLAVIASIFGNSGVVHAAPGAPANGGAQTIKLQKAPGYQPPASPNLTIPPASSLGVQFVHVATAANTSWDTTTIDHPLANGNPTAIILVTPNYTPGNIGGTINNHPIGVKYSGGKWLIFNQDGLQIPIGSAFNVIFPSPGAGVFVHTTAASSGNHTLIDNALTNGHPNAIVFVTPNYTPAGVCGCVYSNFPIGVHYDNVFHKWGIFNQNGPAFSIPDYAAFNVFVLTASTGVFVHTTTAGNLFSDHTLINNPLTNGHPNAIVFVTSNYNPGGTGGTYDNHPIGVFYTADKWSIFNQDGANISLTASFNVLVLVPKSDIFVHTATTGNIHFNHTNIDNALTNGHPNAIVFTTPNLNPGGGSPIYDKHNIGVLYEGQWEIFNQDGLSSPAGLAFNVLVPNPDTSVFVHTATAGNSAADYTTIDYPLTNGNPNAIILVTPNFDPGWVGGVYNDHPIGVEYTGGKWRIYNQDGVAIPPGAAFNVFLPKAGAGVDVFVHTATVPNSGSNMTVIDNPMTNGNPNAIILVTPNFDPGEACACVNVNFPIGVAYVGDIGIGRWAVINQNGTSSSIPLNATFNVYVAGIHKVFLPLIKR
jgi:hypothetical protein